MSTEPRVVILDANALMMPFQFHVDLEAELQRIVEGPYEVAVPDTVVRELEVLSRETSGKDRQEARLALEMARSHKVIKAPEGLDTDTAILRLAEANRAVVVTNDRVLRARLRAKNIPNIHMRSKAYLTLEEG